MEKYGKKGKFCQIQKNTEFRENTELLHPCCDHRLKRHFYSSPCRAISARTLLEDYRRRSTDDISFMFPEVSSSYKKQYFQESIKEPIYYSFVMLHCYKKVDAQILVLF